MDDLSPLSSPRTPEVVLSPSQSQRSTPTIGISQINSPTNDVSREIDLPANNITTADTNATTSATTTESTTVNEQNLQPVLSQNTENGITLELILNRLSTEDNANWMRSLHEKISSRFERVPRGGWPKIVEAYNRQFGEGKTTTEVKNMYSRVKHQRQNREANSASQPEEVTRAVKNVQKFANIKRILLANIEMYKVKREPKARTRKVYSVDVHHDVIEMINIVISNEGIAGSIESLQDINNVIYACQRTYEEITAKPPKKSNWKEAINNKINKIDEDMAVISQFDPNSATTGQVKQLCFKYHIHSHDNDKVTRIKDMLIEKKAVYQKKLAIAENRIKFHQDNKQYELNTSNFYRKLEGPSKQVGEDLDQSEVFEFWSEIWTQIEPTDYGSLVENLPSSQLTIEFGEDKIKSITERIIQFLPNWKAPGPDQVYNFFIKKISSLHPRLMDLVHKAVMEPDQIDVEFYTGYTYLMAKKEGTVSPDELRPITCLPNMYKLISKVMTELATEFCDLNDVISENQMGTRRRCQGAKEQALINKGLNYSNDNLLSTSWIDIKKAYDSVQHQYLIDCLERVEFPRCVIEFVKRTLHNQQTILRIKQNETSAVKIEKGIIQGDALSPLLFVIAMEPLSRILNTQCEKVQMGESDLKRNHLIFVDDVKLLAKDQETLAELCILTDDCLQRMGLEVNQNKSANNVDDDTAFGERVDDVQGYKYLGILEDSRNVIKEENKRMIEEKIYRRVEALCGTKLNARNLFRAINEFAISAINYYVGIIDYGPSEFENIDVRIRQILADHHITRRAANTERLYLSRSELGRGLDNVKEKAERLLLGLCDHLGKDRKDVLEIENRLASHLSMIRQYITTKYQMEESNQVDVVALKTTQKLARLDRIKEKQMHGILFENEEEHIDMRQSSLWLRKGNISPQEEGMLCKLQDRNLLYGQRTCPHCKQANMTVEHLATKCGRMLDFSYKKRHNLVVRCVHFMFAKKYGLSKNKRLKRYKVENVILNDRVRIKSDIAISTDNRIEHNKPDLMIHDLKTNEITLVEVGITNKRILPTTEATKAHKYEFLANELKMMFRGAKVNQIPLVITWDGLVTRYFRNYMKHLGVSEKLQAYMQTIVIKSTCESIVADAKKDFYYQMNDDEFDNLFN